MLTHTSHRVIEWGDCDPAGIVFNPNFFSFFNQCTTELCELAGWRNQDLGEHGFVGCPLVQLRAEFKASCTYGDKITIATGVVEVRRSSFDIEHRLSLGQNLCVSAYETRVWCVRDAATGKIRSDRLPEDLAARLRGEAPEARADKR